jgi:pimeloyl-ACP methyl ester carboxylesterase
VTSKRTGHAPTPGVTQVPAEDSPEDFNHAYLLPELDRLSDSFRLFYYDQRGRGRSSGGVDPRDVTLQSEVDDLDRVRQHLGVEAVALLGHSWGCLLATWLLEDYDLLDPLGQAKAPLLLIHGERDLVPLDCAAGVAGAAPRARLLVLNDCGHFACLERPAEVHEAVVEQAAQS